MYRNNLQTEQCAYHFLPAEIRDHIHFVMNRTSTGIESAGPPALASIAAAMQGTVDLVTPSGRIMPPSLFFKILGDSTSGRSSVLREYQKFFNDFERDVSDPSGSDSDLGRRQILVENATEGGIIEILSQGSKSLLGAYNEGAKSLKQIDPYLACQRFDGDDIRYARSGKAAKFFSKVRFSSVLMIQTDRFKKLKPEKRDEYLECGYFQRNLFSRTKVDDGIDIPIPLQRRSNSVYFDKRMMELLQQDYGSSLAQPNYERQRISYSFAATSLWYEYQGYLKAISSLGQFYQDISVFAARGAELVLRVSACLQWFLDPQREVERWAVEMAIKIVDWHLSQAKIIFGEPSLKAQAEEVAQVVYDYLMQRAATAGLYEITRSELHRRGPAKCRNADRLDMALYELQRSGDIGISYQGRKERIFINLRLALG